jgi:hypothetical protein
MGRRRIGNAERDLCQGIHRKNRDQHQPDVLQKVLISAPAFKMQIEVFKPALQMFFREEPFGAGGKQNADLPAVFLQFPYLTACFLISAGPRP